MADKITVEKRSEIMSKIRGKDTKIELLVRKWLFSNGVRYRKNYRKLPGSPDIALTKYKIAIFVNGCFWHGHQSCKLYKLPKTRTDFWQAKVTRNRQRDQQKIEDLESLGWKVIVIWECEVRNSFDETMKRLLDKINMIKGSSVE